MLKRNVYDRVWTMENNRAVVVHILGIHTIRKDDRSCDEPKTETLFTVSQDLYVERIEGLPKVFGDSIFSSKQELLDSL